MKRFPKEFEGLLSPKGRKALKNRSFLSLGQRESRFLAVEGWVSLHTAQAACSLLEKALKPLLVPMEEPIPAWTISAMRENYAELLPKTVRVQTAVMASTRSKAFQRAQEIGLVDMLKSESFHALAQRLSGYALSKKWGTQVLCYQAGDYTGPHNDHHPEDAEAASGYVDLHLTLCHSSVAQQLLVYEEQGHFSKVQSVATFGGLTCYRLPFWHYTTPLLAKRGREASAQRWVLLGTFLDKKSSLHPRTQTR